MEVYESMNYMMSWEHKKEDLHTWEHVNVVKHIWECGLTHLAAYNWKVDHNIFLCIQKWVVTLGSIKKFITTYVSISSGFSQHIVWKHIKIVLHTWEHVKEDFYTWKHIKANNYSCDHIKLNHHIWKQIKMVGAFKSLVVRACKNGTHLGE